MGFFQNITEGGQTWAHRIRMFRQVIKMTLGTSLLFALLIYAILMAQIAPIYYQGAWYYLKATAVSAIADRIEVDPVFWEKVAHERKSAASNEISTGKVIHLTEKFSTHLGAEAIKNLVIAGKYAFTACGMLLLFFLVRGRSRKNKKHISGSKIVTNWVLKMKLILRRNASDIHIGSIPFVKNSETQHFLITGGTGSGKTNCLFHLLDQVREKKQKAVVIDTSGSFTQRFLRPGKDILLNPFDPQSAHWNPWIECSNKFDYEALAESFIPQSYAENENYWRQAARSLFSSLLQKLSDTQKISELIRWSLFEPLPELCQFVAGTKAAAHMDINSEKTAGSIRSVASAFLECIENLNDSPTPFSIRKWVENPQTDSWLFIHCTPAQRAAITPLVSSWIAIAIRSLINLPPDQQRRLWFFLDELQTLNKVRDLESLLTEGRKYGGCGVLALQGLSQLENIYGNHSTKTIIGNCSTKIIFSEQDPEIATRISKMFGEQELKETNEGISYGAHEVRDGVSLSTQTKKQPIVSPTAIQSLEKNTAFLRLPGNYPVTKIKLQLFGG